MIRKVLVGIVYTVCIVAWLWFIASFIDVNIHNVSHEEAQKINKYNVFILMTEGRYNNE